jgi:hypothetical protein
MSQLGVRVGTKLIQQLTTGGLSVTRGRIVNGVEDYDEE